MRFQTTMALWLSALALPLWAQQDWRATPMRLDINVQPGQTLERIVTLSNESDSAKTFQIVLHDWVQQGANRERELEPGLFERGCAAWVRYTPVAVTIPAGGSRPLNMTITVPDTGLAPGSHWAAFYIQPTAPPRLMEKASGEKASVNVYVQMRVKVNLHCIVAGETHYEGTITRSGARWKAGEGVEVVSFFKNTGNLKTKCTGHFEVRDDAGNTVESFEMKAFYSYPDQERPVAQLLPASLKPGSYSLLTVIDFGGDYLVAGEAFFDVPAE